MLLAWVSAVWRSGRLRIEPAELLPFVGPAVRLVAMTCLFWAGLAKLNRDFLNPEISCAAELYDYQAYCLPVLPQGPLMRSAAPWLAIFGELGGAVLLAHRRTRLVGLWLALGFLLTVGLNPHTRVFVFAGPVMAALSLFVPGAVWLRMRDSRPLPALRGWLEGPGQLVRDSLPLLLLAVLVIAIHGEPKTELRALRHGAITALFYAGGPLAIGALIWAWRRERPGPPRAIFTGAGRLGIAVALLMFAHQGLMLVGLNSRTHFNMASNFTVSPYFSNHLLPRPPRWGFNEPVRILETNSKYLRNQMKGSTGIAWFYFRDEAARTPGRSVRFRHAGVTTNVERIGDRPDLFRTSVYAWAFRYNRIPLKKRQSVCGHTAPQNRKAKKEKKERRKAEREKRKKKKNRKKGSAK